MRASPLLLATAAVGLALPAIAQQATQPAPATPIEGTQSPAPSQQSEDRLSSRPGADESDTSSADEGGFAEVSAPTSTVTIQPPIEYPGWARRDPWTVGRLDPSSHGLGSDPWGASSGAFLATLMRRMHTPLASRWAQMAVRDVLLAKARAPRDVNPVDWVAARSWLLLRMGEADAARLLIDGVDTDRFTPTMVQVGVQTALATADVAALCPLQDGIRRDEPRISPLVQAMCAALAGDSDSASAQIDSTRRSNRIGGVDLALAQKVVGAAGSGRAANIEWDSVDTMTAWRFGLAAATGMVAPDRLVNAASPQLRAFEARAPMLMPEQRLRPALSAAGLGVFSSQSLVDLYSQAYDATDPNDLPSTDAWQLRIAYVGKDQDIRLAAIRKLLGVGKDGLEKEGAMSLVSRAATLVVPNANLAKDAPDLIRAMLAGGFDRAAARWIPVIDKMDDEQADRCWAMLALAAPDGTTIRGGRLSGFISRDKSHYRVRSALLVAGLAGLGRISTSTADSLNRRYDLGIAHSTSWTRAIDSAAQQGQIGTVRVLAGTGLQTASWMTVPGSHLFHIVQAMQRTGQDFTARMIAAEALSRT